MLFNTLQFQFAFLPVALAGFYLLGRWSRWWAAVWLSAASLFFYGWWNPRYVVLLLASVAFNYGAGRLIGREARKPGNGLGRVLLGIAVASNLLLLGYYKYAGFFAGMANELSGSSLSFGQIILPLGISFFTFTQIAFLVDAFQQRVGDYACTHYLLFVTYFPHLIAGPILHHGQIMPQFAERRTYRPDWANISAGLTYFVIGLAKKILLADRLAGIATPVFSAAQHGAQPCGVEAWGGALAYTLQLYFDFSGYTDMAIGISLCFNVRLPFNFNSPYKASSIIEFWRRWHMTLAAFLRDYLYIPLGGNRRGTSRRYVNLLVTMLLGGLWHGAAWTFVAWGGLHGVYLIVNHGFRALAVVPTGLEGLARRVWALAAGAATFLGVVVAWVLFRADSFGTAWVILRGMGRGLEGLRAAAAGSPVDGNAVLLILAGLAAVWLLPNTQQFMRGVFSRDRQEVAAPADWSAGLVWEPRRWWIWSGVGILFGLLILMMAPANVSEFLYYQF